MMGRTIEISPGRTQGKFSQALQANETFRGHRDGGDG